MARRRQRQGRRRARLLRFGAAVAVVAAIVAGAVTAWAVIGSSGSDGPPRAAIIDQLSLTFPNPEFSRNATEKLEQAGYEVDYFPGEEVTVDFYRKLTVHGYDFIVFRSHADRLKATSREGEEVDEVILFTSEPYDRERYTSDQATNRLVIARYREGGEPYFGVASDFIDEQLGDFDGATIVMMGCEGLLTERTAQAFVERGAKSYISWDETVSAAHTDAATEQLLQHLLIEGLPEDEAVTRTMAEVGPDPTYGSELRVYPPEG